MKPKGIKMLAKVKVKKAQIWVSAVLYVLMTTILMVVVLEAGVPLLNDMKDKSIFVQTKDNFVSLSQHIEEVSSSGPGSQRLVPIEIKKGYLSIGNEKVKWSMDTTADILAPMSKISLGNVKISSDADVDAYESGNYYILENFYMLAAFNKIGNSTAYGDIISNNIIGYLQFKGTGGTANGTFDFSVNGVPISGTGYTGLVDAGYDKASGSVIALVNNTEGNYTIIFSLKGDTDFMLVNVE